MPIENSGIDDFIKNQELPEELKNVKFSGSIQDAQALFNISNLWDVNFTTINLAGMQTYSNLLEQLGLNKNLANQTAQYVLRNNQPLQYLEELINVPGYTSDAIKKISQFAIVLPEPTTININTVSVEVLLAMWPTLSPADAIKLTQLRLAMPLKNQSDITTLLSKVLPNKLLQSDSSIGVKSDYWIANTNMLIEQRNINNQTLIKRFIGRQSDNNFTVVLWSKQKVTQVQ
jgi:general secretion pathway protein K